MAPASSRRWIGAIFLLALFVRLAAIFALKRWDDATPGVHRQLALSLLEHGAFYFRDWAYFGPSSIVTPPYPMLLAFCFALFGAETPTAYFAALTVNALFGAATALATLALVRRMIGHDAPAMLAGLLVAIWPPQIVATIFVQPIALSSLILVTLCVLWRRISIDTRVLPAISFAIAAALAALLEPVMLPGLIAFAFLMLFSRRQSIDLRIRNIALLAAAAMLLIWPWVARNRAVHGQWLMTTTLWQSVWAGANENATGSDRLTLTPDRRGNARQLLAGDDSAADAVRVPMMQIDALSSAARYALREKPEIDRDSQFRAWANDYLRSHRGEWVAGILRRVAKVWFIDWDHPMSRNMLAMIPRALLAAAALVGLIVIVRYRAGASGPIIVLACFCGSAAVSAASARQTLAIEPLQIALAVGGLVLLRRESPLNIADEKMTNVA